VLLQELSSNNRVPRARSSCGLCLPNPFPIAIFGVSKSYHKSLIFLATPAGLEPATFSLEGTCGCCSINAHSDKSTVFRAIEPKRLSAAVRMKANDSTGQSFKSPSEHDMSSVSLPASLGIDFRQ
jgi:hypothetical protein